jgi:hypothetical protein
MLTSAPLKLIKEDKVGKFYIKKNIFYIFKNGIYTFQYHFTILSSLIKIYVYINHTFNFNI